MHNIAIIGAGDIVRKAYLPALSRRGDCRVMAICSQSGHSAHELAMQYQIPFMYQDYQELLQRKDIDVVFICTPTALHRPISEAAIASQKHLLVEKPLCTTYSDSHALLQQAACYEYVFYPAFNNRFREENQYFYNHILSGKIGALELFDFEWYRTKRYIQKDWLYNPSMSGGGVLMDLGTHLLHLALGLLPKRRKFSAFCNNIIHDSSNSIVEDTSTALLSIDNNISIVMKLGWDMHLPTASRVNLQVFCSQGIVSNFDYQGEKTDGYALMIQDFFAHIDTNTRPDLNLVDNTMQMIEALYLSSLEKRCVSGEFFYGGVE